MNPIKGIDVSEWQGQINFDRVKQSGIQFVIIRAGYGNSTSQKDRYFEENYSKAKAAGLKVGAYWYSYASSPSDAVLEAQACLTILGNRHFDYPIYFDLEEQWQFKQGRDFCDQLVKNFCNTLEAHNYYAGFYISRSPLQSYISPVVARRYAACC